MSVDGPLKLILRRSIDKPARLWVQRWKADHPVTIALDPDEVDELEAAIKLYREQVAIAPNSETPSGSVLELSPLVHQGAAA